MQPFLACSSLLNGACIVVAFLFAVGEEAAVLLTLCSPAHGRAAVEHADATARDHDVELSLLNVTTDVCRHNDELLALEFFGVGVRRVVVTFAGKCELEALATGSTVRSRNSRKSEAHVGTTVNGKRNLACTCHHATTAADTLSVPVSTFGLSLVGALLGMVGGIVLSGAMGLAAIPVTSGPTGAALSAALDDDVRTAASQLLTAGARLCAAAGLGAGTALRISRGSEVFAFLVVGVVIAFQSTRVVVCVFFTLRTSLLIVFADAFR